MASGDLIVKVADKDTLDRTYANTNAILAAVGEDVRIKGVKRYGMKINKNDSNPATRCTYLFDAVGMTPAAMNYSAGRFDFGDWGNVFFVKKIEVTYCYLYFSYIITDVSNQLSATLVFKIPPYFS